MLYYTWWQSLIRIGNLALILGGIFGLIAALFYRIRGGPYHPGRHPLWVALGSLIALALGLLSSILLQELTAPRQATFY